MTRKFNDQELSRRKKLSELQSKGSCPFEIESVKIDYSIEEILKLDESFTSEISCAGRILFIRQTFLIISEFNKRLQLYIDLKEEKNQDLYIYFKNYIDIGDYIHATGKLFKTKTGMLTLKVSALNIISKSLKPLPEKYSGITNSELLVRNRVGSLITNPEQFSVLEKRARIISELRSFLSSFGYLEFETPILHKIAGGAIAKPFKTFHNTLKEDLYLRVAPELYLKRLIVSGFPKVYEIGRSFRNEGVDSWHNPEFSSIEIYTSYFGMDQTMDFTEQLLSHLFNKFIPNKTENPLLFQKFRRIAIWEELSSQTGFDFYNNPPDLEKLLNWTNSKGIHLDEEEKTLSNIYEKLFEELVVPNLNKPTFVYGFSSFLSPLAKKDPNNTFFAKRFELYINGVELANGFSEQNNPIEQETQFRIQLQDSEENRQVDYDYIYSLEYGLPPTGGVGIGLDRLIMFILDKKTIKEVIAFPFLKG